MLSLLPFCAIPGALWAQAPAGPAKEPDTLLFTNGEKLIGHFERSTGGSVIFKSEMAGTVTVPWSKVKELHAAGTYALIPKNVELTRKTKPSDIVQGSVSMANGSVQVAAPSGPAAPPIPVADVPYVVSESEFRQVTQDRPSFFSGWKGGVTAGASLVEATQTSQVFTGSLALVRVEPFVDWFTPSNRTTVNFSASYGKVTDPGDPTIRTEIYHADGERDEYFSKRFYGFGQIAFDHNFSQGLDLEQLYGGGLGITVFKRANQEFDAKASADYIRQAFTEASSNRNLIGSQFGDTYFYKFPKGVLFTQALTVTPAWNDTHAWTGLGSASLLFPAYKRLSFNLTAQDNYLNDPPPAFKRNSFQFTAGLTYTIR